MVAQEINLPRRELREVVVANYIRKEPVPMAGLYSTLDVHGCRTWMALVLSLMSHRGVLVVERDWALNLTTSFDFNSCSIYCQIIAIRQSQINVNSQFC